MFIELVDALRCPHDHAESWLVLAADRMDGRDVVEGVLGCPVCRAEFPIARGVADLRVAPPSTEGESGDAAAAAPVADAGLRLAALLNLTDAQGFALLVGATTRHAAALGAVADTHLLLVNPVAGAGALAASVLLADGALPLAAASARGIALDDAAGPSMLAGAVRALRPGGRLVAPVALAVPAGVIELARDAAVWVGEREAGASGLVSLARGGR